MPLSTTSPPPPSSSSPENMQQETKRIPLGVKSIGGSGSTAARSSPRTDRPVLGERRITTMLDSRNKTDGDVVEENKSRFPTATIDADSISDIMAARLATCLLGHVLFLKSQVPFPVAQLIKMHSRNQKSDDHPATNKKLEKLLVSFDLLSSHLGSTFTALSSALSHKYDSTGPTETLSTSRLEKDKAHFAILLGPSPTAAHAIRARVVLELDGLRVLVASRRLATRPSSRESRGQLTINSHLKENECAAHARSQLRDVPRESGIRHVRPRGSFERCVYDSDSEASSQEEGCEEELDLNVVQNPPDSDTDVSSDESDGSSGNESDLSDRSSSPGFEEETEADLCAAERLLSRTLAIANADPALGMAAEIRPTQIHVLIRAPRRFSHPSWRPRQEMLRDMDRLLSGFEEEGVAPCSSGSRKDRDTEVLHDVTNASPESKTSKKVETKRKGPGGIKTNYVRVCSRTASDTKRGVARVDESPVRDDVEEDGDARDEGDESAGHDDEMIWWSWDGKLEGFMEL